MGWFYGLKLHFVINHKDQVMALKITPGNTADSTALDEMTQRHRQVVGCWIAKAQWIARRSATGVITPPWRRR
jgi:hypothetical protein